MPTPHRPNFDPKWILIHQRPFSNERHLFGSLSFVTLMHQFVLCFVVRYLGNQVGFYMCTVWIGRLGRSPLHSSQQCLFFFALFCHPLFDHKAPSWPITIFGPHILPLQCSLDTQGSKFVAL